MDAHVDWSVLTDGDLARVVTNRTADASAAEAEICARLARRVRLYGLRHLGSASTADDLAQRAMIVLLEKLRSGAVHEPDRIGAFVLGVARMLAHESRREGIRERDLLPGEDDGPRGEPVPSDTFASSRLGGCLAELGERERSVVVLTYYGEADSRQVANTLGLTEGHVRVIRHRALAQLRGCLKGAGIDRLREVLSSEDVS